MEREGRERREERERKEGDEREKIHSFFFLFFSFSFSFSLFLFLFLFLFFFFFFSFSFSFLLSLPDRTKDGPRGAWWLSSYEGRRHLVDGDRARKAGGEVQPMRNQETIKKAGYHPFLSSFSIIGQSPAIKTSREIGIER